jgi:Fur family zinc uptake transcriptional regulator
MAHSSHPSHPSHPPRIEDIEALCQQRGVRFTPMRKTVYVFLLAQKSPITAYDALAKLQVQLKKALAPPTVYRALDFLLEQGLIHRLETNNSYLACDHPGHHHDSIYLVCSHCGDTQEIEDADISQLVQKRAQEQRFQATKQVLEVAGLCGRCQ